MISFLQKHRLEYQPTLPKSLINFQDLTFAESIISHPEEIKSLFPHTHGQPLLHLTDKVQEIDHHPLKVGVVLSGGQAAGGHNVIIGLFNALQAMHPSSTLYGFLDGPAGIINNKHIHLDIKHLERFRNQGGFDMIGSGRDKIETPEQFESSAKTVQGLDLDGLVVIGGDDSNTNAALLAEYFVLKKIKTKVIGVPKTIDGDLMNEYIEISFGFDTATKTYSELIGNILRDCLSAKKYYFFIKIMGRSASHIALECALQTHNNMTLIGEEIAAKKMTFKQIVDSICDMIEARAKVGKDYGVIVIPEGVIEFLTEVQFPQDLDPHGNLQVSKIETERFILSAVEIELNNRGAKPISAQPLFLGYEGRSGLPSNFDSQYCNALGYVAAILVDRGVTGYMACLKGLKGPVDSWQVLGVPLTTMIHMEERKGKMKPVIRKALVDLDATPFIEFQKHRKHWELHDDFMYPGPIQFFGPAEVTEAVPMSLRIR